MLENIIFSSINYEYSPLVNAIELYAITLEKGLICQLLVITLSAVKTTKERLTNEIN
jgi:hypothetical protein